LDLGPHHQPHDVKLQLRRRTGQETTLWLEFMLKGLASRQAGVELDWAAVRSGSDGRLMEQPAQLLESVLLRANRIELSNRSLAQCAEVLGIVRRVQETATPELHLKAGRLAETLHTRRWFVFKVCRECEAQGKGGTGASTDAEGVAANPTSPDHCVACGKDCAQAPASALYDPRFAVFEYTKGLILRRRQVELVRDIVQEVDEVPGVVKQMIMGQGKTTVISPLLCTMLADGRSLVVQICPDALLRQTCGILRSAFVATMPKNVFTFTCSRSSEVDSFLVEKLQKAQRDCGIILSTPRAVKSLMLRYVENCFGLQTTKFEMRAKTMHMQKLLALEHAEVEDSWKQFIDYQRVQLEAHRARINLKACRDHASSLENKQRLLGKALRLFQGSIALIDEVDMVMHPLKSELNFPVGARKLADFAPDRWDLPQHLLGAILEAHGTVMAGKVEGTELALELQKHIKDGLDQKMLLKEPHLVLLDR
jgi:hypothetical protein